MITNKREETAKGLIYTEREREREGVCVRERERKRGERGGYN